MALAHCHQSSPSGTTSNRSISTSFNPRLASTGKTNSMSGTFVCALLLVAHVLTYPENHGTNCEPSGIVVGGIYRTENAIFALNVESLRDPVSTAPLGSANYSGDVLDSCRVNRIFMMAQFATHEAQFRVCFQSFSYLG